MIVRAVAALVLTCALTCSAASAVSSKRRPQVPKSPEEPMSFYVVKGAPDACVHFPGAAGMRCLRK